MTLSRSPGPMHRAPRADAAPPGPTARGRVLAGTAVAVLAGLLGGCGAAEFEERFAAGLIDPARLEVDTKGDCRLEVHTPPGGNDPALSVEAGTEARCEVVPVVWPRGLGSVVREPFGRPRTYRFRVLVPDGHVPHPRNEVIAQWHSSPEPYLEAGLGRGPNLALRLAENRWYVTYGFDADFLSTATSATSGVLWEAPLATGAWIDFAFSVTWTHRDGGSIQVFMDGVPVADYRGPTAYNDLRGVYLKLGLYHPGRPRTIWIDDIEIRDGPFR